MYCVYVTLKYFGKRNSVYLQSKTFCLGPHVSKSLFGVALVVVLAQNSVAARSLALPLAIRTCVSVSRMLMMHSRVVPVEFVSLRQLRPEKKPRFVCHRCVSPAAPYWIKLYYCRYTFASRNEIGLH